MALLEDNRPIIADLLDGLGMANGAEILRYVAAEDARLDEDEQQELERLRMFADDVQSVLDAKGSAASKTEKIREALEEIGEWGA
jgi:hypothetical protein